MRRTACKWNERANKTEEALIKKEMQNLGRWCEVVLKTTGEKVKVVRTGYGPMEYPEKDSHDVIIDGVVVASFRNLYGVALWMCNR